MLLNHCLGGYNCYFLSFYFQDLLKLVFDCDSERPRSIVVETLKQILEELMTLPPISAVRY